MTKKEIIELIEKKEEELYAKKEKWEKITGEGSEETCYYRGKWAEIYEILKTIKGVVK